jgi:NAD+ diphosphatase
VSTFVPGLTPNAEVAPPTWIVIRDGEILLDKDSVFVDSPEALGLSPVRRIFLGTLDGRPCFAADVDAPNDTRFIPLRGAIAFASEEHFGLLSTAAQLVHFERTHVFCGRCGARFGDLPSERAKACAACGLHAYPRVSPAVIVVVHDDRRILLAHRPKMPFFALIAGFVESGETLEQCVAREVAEEIGVEVGETRYFGSQPWPFPHQIMIGFFARYVRGDIKVDGKELDEARWFEKDALPPLPPPISIARKMIDAWTSGGAADRV